MSDHFSFRVDKLVSFTLSGWSGIGVSANVAFRSAKVALARNFCGAKDDYGINVHKILRLTKPCVAQLSFAGCKCGHLPLEIPNTERASHTLTVLSSLPVTSRVPFALIAKLLIPCS